MNNKHYYIFSIILSHFATILIAIHSKNNLHITTSSMLSKKLLKGSAFIVNREVHHDKSKFQLFGVKKNRKIIARSLSTISTAEDNMNHIKKCIDENTDTILSGLDKKGWVVLDNFLGNNVCDIYRKEAVGCYNRKEMVISQSTRWDKDSNSVITYDKHNVYATQLNGGESYYGSPRLHEYVVSIVKNLVPIIDKKFPEALLSSTLASNKLAVCTGKY